MTCHTAPVRAPKAARAEHAPDRAVARRPVPIGNQARLRRLSATTPRVQPRLQIGTLDDPLEREADTVTEAVMRMPAPALSVSTASPQISRKCAACAEEHKKLKMKPANTSAPAAGAAPAVVHEVVRSPGHPLDPATRAFFEPRFGYDLGNVRIHTGSSADASARRLNALAYTAGSDIVVAGDHYSPNTGDGRKLLAHELTHVIQQTGEGGGVAIQRKCNADVPKTVGCVPDPSITPPSTRFLFDVNCDDFAPGQEAAMDAFAKGISPTGTVRIVGLASFDGPADLNERLSCSRAQFGVAVIKRSAPSTVTISSVDASVGGPSTPSDPKMRAVGVVVSTPSPTCPPCPEEPRTPGCPACSPVEKPKCGPDATDWFVRQVNDATGDKDVLGIKALLASADLAASTAGSSVAELGEAGATTAVLTQESLLGAAAPPRTAIASGQIAAGSGSLSAAKSHATDPGVIAASPLIAAAAINWRSLVNHGARYDFKAHVDSMNHPKSATCPDEKCPPGEVGIITLCPGARVENCYESDLPGNLFYALIGRFVGWSQLTLQLGSQLAELTDTGVRPGHPSVTWDTPDDTAAIAVGFALPLPLTQSALCDFVPKFRAALAKREGCADCTEPTPSVIK
jgi:outer membrane protein OmpA-like peptidoglycan-associated protein